MQKLVEFNMTTQENQQTYCLQKFKTSTRQTVRKHLRKLFLKSF